MKRLVLLALLAPGLAHADPDDAPPAPADKPVDEAPQPVAAKPYKKWYFRGGVAYVHPFSSSGPMTLSGVDGPASLAVQNGPIAGSGATISDATIPAITIGYVTPWLHHRISIETILGPPLDVKFNATGTLANQSIAPTALGIPTGIPALGPQLGEAKAVPPVITAVYSLMPDSKVRPYAGGGVAVMITSEAHITNPYLTMAGKPEFTVDPAPGIALQAGVDATIYKRIYARLDVKFIGLMEARGTVTHIQMNAPDLPIFGPVDVGTAKMNVWVNPLIVQAGIGTDF